MVVRDTEVEKMKFFVLAALSVAGYLFGATGLDLLVLNYWSEVSGNISLVSAYGRALPGILFILGACLLGLSFTRHTPDSHSK